MERGRRSPKGAQIGRPSNDGLWTAPTAPDQAKNFVLIFRLPEGAMSGTRKLAAILVADVVGYSRLAGADRASRAPKGVRKNARLTTGYRARLVL